MTTYYVLRSQKFLQKFTFYIVNRNRRQWTVKHLHATAGDLLWLSYKNFHKWFDNNIIQGLTDSKGHASKPYNRVGNLLLLAQQSCDIFWATCTHKLLVWVFELTVALYSIMRHIRQDFHKQEQNSTCVSMKILVCTVYYTARIEARGDTVSWRIPWSVSDPQHDASRQWIQRLRTSTPSQRQTPWHEESDARRRRALRHRHR